MAATDAARAQTGFYCSTSGTYFADKESLTEHYRSDFHRYNLKRKVAGLPPVTKEWFEARKAQLSSTAASATAAAPVQRIWVDPLTKKKFNTENTYQVFVGSKKYAELVRKSGQPAPAPVIVTRQPGGQEGAPQAQEADGGSAAGPPAAKAAGFKVVAPSGGLPGVADTDMAEASTSAAAAAAATGNGKQQQAQQQQKKGAWRQRKGEGEEDEDEDDDDDDGSGWETASDDEAAELAAAGGAAMQDGEEADDAQGGEQEWPEWDVRRSLFDNHMSDSFQANLEYMFKRFGFYLPDSQYLKDPEGLLKYLGAKLQVGGVPLGTRGDDAHARQFRSLHAVQRHMVDTCACKMLYDDNEEEYEEYYDYDMPGGEDDTNEAGGAIVVAGGGGGGGVTAVAGYELVVGGGGEDGMSGGKVLGHREFARLYRQRPRPEDDRRSVVVNTMLARYRALGAPTSTDAVKQREVKAEASRSRYAAQASQLKMSMIKNVLKKLPKNCEY
ncbi:hypothetical protein HYH02_015197 [Chlamydomonas schloesseri]|uniref:ZN622/Rei1/Reh1 zinc finger C2H2-type domain-containing protein n=1 Tax=Chlamydomonas schloesseri TaxID=2026947 RepID=A0A835SGB1_9CHLO|nr:hypothetical protein HYH02_015197 [Chlamydomonas schloesseri]|eukprot:KAG2424307.1 hypothetical protein HYH02_015197 [Chlamydomonas schloesseri]